MPLRKPRSDASFQIAYSVRGRSTCHQQSLAASQKFPQPPAFSAAPLSHLYPKLSRSAEDTPAPTLLLSFKFDCGHSKQSSDTAVTSAARRLERQCPSESCPSVPSSAIGPQRTIMASQTAVNGKGFTVLHEAPHAVVDIVFVHGFTGHPKDTWTLKGAKAQSTSRPGKHGQDDDPSARSSKIPRLGFFSRSPSSQSAAASTQPIRTSIVEDAASRGTLETVISEGPRRNDVYWPADLTCETVPDSRILTYGYDTKVRHLVRGPVSSKSVYDHAWDLLCSLEALRRNPNEICRPVLFVAHSLGGIVVKEALRRSRGSESTKPHLHAIFRATAGVLFFGTPHRGADPRGFLHHVLTTSAKALGVQVNEQIVGTLMPNAERLVELREEFLVMSHERKWQIYSFQEEYGIAGLFGRQVVDDVSSSLDDLMVETKQHISSNHMDMCRFSGLQDPEYSKVAAAMARILETIRAGSAPARPGQPLDRRQSQVTCHSVVDTRVDRESSIIGERHREPATPQETRYQAVNDDIPEDIKQSLIDKLYFTKIDERLTSLTAAQGTTCRWFLAKQEYRAWCNPAEQPDHGGFLWIKGNPGTGKSTLMKFLFEDAKLRSRGDPSQITLSFFFLAQGTLEEKSTPGLYRSLLHQLFGKAADLKDSLEWMTADGARGIHLNGWQEEALKQTLAHAIRKLGSRSLSIFVDALDECKDSQAKGMVCFFEELCDLAHEMGVRLRICFSSRHYPHIEVKKGITVILEDEVGHTEDLRHYIRSKLRLRKSKPAESLQSELLDKSSQIFLWVVLVIDILNSEYPGKPIEKMRKRLREIPQKLADLFEIILLRDGENPELLQICLNWILFSTRPLKPQELYFAIQLGIDPECSGYWDQETVDLDEMKTFVRSSSKGLAEVTRNKASEVQFIHESVRDFLLGRYECQWSDASGNFVGHGHEILRDCCLAQLERASSSQNIDIPVHSPRSFEAAQLREAIALKFPLLSYSVLNILRHANSSQQHGMEQAGFLNGFLDGVFLRRWITLHDIIERYAVRRYGESVSLLYILAEKNLAHLVKVYPLKESCFKVGSGRYGPPILAALATGSNETTQALIEIQVRAQPPDSPLHDILNQYSERETKHSKLGFEFVFPKTGNLFRLIDEHGDIIILALLLLSGHADVNQLDDRGWTPLMYAAAEGHEAVVKLLLEHGAEVELKDDVHWDHTPLWHAICGGHYGTVKLLLEKGAGLEDEDEVGQSPLKYAVSKGHETIVQLLLEKGANIEARGLSGLTPLHFAISNNNQAVVKLLLEKGANIEAAGRSGLTPLYSAISSNNQAVVELLLEKGANAEARDLVGWTPLFCAVSHGQQAMVELLLDKGADIEAVDEAGYSPLLYAVQKWDEKMVKFLLEKGANVEAEDAEGFTALSYAAARGHISIVKMLLERGVRVDREDWKGRTALSIAIERGHEALVPLLTA